MNTKKLIFNGHSLEMYTSISELPITRFQIYNLNAFVDSGIGSDLNAFDQRCANISRLMRKDVESADKEIMNLRQCIRFVLSKSSPKMRSFCVLITRIDGRIITEDDLTENGIDTLIEELGKKGLTVKIIDSFLKFFKKKIELEFETLLPKMSDNALVKDIYSKLKQRTQLVLDSIIKSVDLSSEIEKIDEFLLSIMSPKNFFGASGVEASSINSFEDTCIILEHHKLSSDAKKMTVLAFYRAVIMLKAIMAKQNKNGSNKQRQLGVAKR